jgi:predicted nucleic acid-binding protein
VILFDSSILIDVLRGHDGARLAMRAAAQSEPVAASELTRVELLAGMRSAERSQVRALLDRLRLVEVDAGVAQRAGELARDHRRSHQGVGIVDYVIAATAEVHHADLWTTNVKHFPMFEGLVAPY